MRLDTIASSPGGSHDNQKPAAKHPRRRAGSRRRGSAADRLLVAQHPALVMKILPRGHEENGRRNLSPLMRGALAETFGEQRHGQGVEAHPFALGALGEPS